MEDIFEMAREQSNVTSAQYASSTLLKYANKRYKMIQNAIITKVDEKYFYDILLADTQALQNEYTLKSVSGTVAWVKKIITANIKRKSTDTYYSKLAQSTTNISSQAIDEQKASPDQQDFYEMKDGSFFVFPAPTESIEDGIMCEAIITLPDLVVAWGENTVFPYNSELRDYHYIIALWVRADIFSLKMMFDEKNVAEQEFRDELSIMISDISNRVNNDMTGTLPSGNKYK